MWEYNTAYLGAANDAEILALFRKWAEAVRWLRRREGRGGGGQTLCRCR